MADWKPGDVAMMDGALSPLIVFRYRDLDTGSLEWMSAVDGGAYPGGRYPVRPLVVIDPEDREQVERLMTLAAHNAYVGTDSMQAALREFANPTPVIEEPTALYAVVRDTGGHEWCHVGGQVWRSLTSTGQFKVEKHWYDTGAPLAGNVTRVLSFGYTEDGA